MIDRIAVITLGLLVIANFAAALISTIDWQNVNKRFHVYISRTRQWYAVAWEQLEDEDQVVLRWMGRTAWVMVLVGTWAALL